MDDKLLEKTTKEFLAQMDVEGKIEVEEREASFFVVKIISDEAGLLIGQGGENLAALQHLLRAVVNKKTAISPVNFIIDVNDYRANRAELLKEITLSVARQVIREKKSKWLEPMPSYERRLVHVLLKDFEGVKTESQGEGAERRIIIKPVDEY